MTPAALTTRSALTAAGARSREAAAPRSRPRGPQAEVGAAAPAEARRKRPPATLEAVVLAPLLVTFESFTALLCDDKTGKRAARLASRTNDATVNDRTTGSILFEGNPCHSLGIETIEWANAFLANAAHVK